MSWYMVFKISIQYMIWFKFGTCLVYQNYQKMVQDWKYPVRFFLFWYIFVIEKETGIIVLLYSSVLLYHLYV